MVTAGMKSEDVCFLAGKLDKPMQYVEKQTLLCWKHPYSQGYGLPSGICDCESWTIKKVEGQRIGAFELWCCRKLPRVPWTARRLNQSISREIDPEYLLEELKLKLQYFGHLMLTPDNWKSPWCWKRLQAEEEGVRGWDGWWHHRCNEHDLGQTSGDGEGQRGLVCCSLWGHKELDTTGRLNSMINIEVYHTDPPSENTCWPAVTSAGNRQSPLPTPSGTASAAKDHRSRVTGLPETPGTSWRPSDGPTKEQFLLQTPCRLARVLPGIYHKPNSPSIQFSLLFVLHQHWSLIIIMCLHTWSQYLLLENPIITTSNILS